MPGSLGTAGSHRSPRSAASSARWACSDVGELLAQEGPARVAAVQRAKFVESHGALVVAMMPGIRGLPF